MAAKSRSATACSWRRAPIRWPGWKSISGGRVAGAARRGRAAAGAGGWLALILLPLIEGGYWIFTLGLCFANAIASISVSFLVRYGGEVSSGHGVFMAAGAYTVALMEKYLGVPLLASLPVAALVGA